MIFLNEIPTIPIGGAGVDPQNIVDDALKLSDALSTYGAAIVLLSIFLIIFIVVICVILRQNSNSQKMFQEQNQILLNQILSFSSKAQNDTDETKPVVDDGKKSYDEKNIVTIFVKLNRIFKFECKKYLERVNCDRIGIYVFHNGTAASHGLPFFKVTCICEWVKRGSAICNHINDTNGIPLNLFDDIIEGLYTRGIVLVCNLPDSDDPDFVKSDSFYLDVDHAEFAIFIPIYDKNDNILAMLLVEYHNMIDKELIKGYVEDLKDLCQTIKPVLEFSEYQNISTTERG